MKRIDAVRELYFKGYRASLAECLIPCRSDKVLISVSTEDKEYTMYDERSDEFLHGKVISTLEELENVIHS